MRSVCGLKSSTITGLDDAATRDQFVGRFQARRHSHATSTMVPLTRRVVLVLWRTAVEGKISLEFRHRAPKDNSPKKSGPSQRSIQQQMGEVISSCGGLCPPSEKAKQQKQARRKSMLVQSDEYINQLRSGENMDALTEKLRGYFREYARCMVCVLDGGTRIVATAIARKGDHAAAGIATPTKHDSHRKTGGNVQVQKPKSNAERQPGLPFPRQSGQHVPGQGGLPPPLPRQVAARER